MDKIVDVMVDTIFEPSEVKVVVTVAIPPVIVCEGPPYCVEITDCCESVLKELSEATEASDIDEMLLLQN